MKLANTLTKKIAIGALAIATYFGSIHGTEGVWPIYTKITGKNYGINLSLINQVEKSAEFNGLQLNLVNINYGTANGVSLGGGVKIEDSGSANGVQAGLVIGNQGKLNGISLGIANVLPHRSVDDAVNGFQLGIYNGAGKGNYVQLGILNETPDKLSLLLNSYFNEVKE